MKTTLLLSLGLSIFLSACCKEHEADLPSEVKLGQSVVYLNGCKEDYEPDFKLIKVYSHINFAFVDKYDDVVNLLAFDWLPIQTGDFELHTERIQYIKALTSFGQTVDEDLTGYEYELEVPEEGFFNIEALDTVNQEVKGRFRAQFRRTTKNGYKHLGLPETLLFQGVFNEKYEVY
ncbi:MAG: hypothetical protein ACKVU0_20825 [Saprospiraceae bacterium]